MLLREHLYLLIPCAAETLRRSTKLLKESSLDKQIIKKLHSKQQLITHAFSFLVMHVVPSDVSGFFLQIRLKPLNFLALSVSF